MKQEGAARRAMAYFWRATRLRCPVCGQKPIFPPWQRVRRLSDWFTPLDGCPRCGYAYEREPGYFLLAIWAVNYGCGSLLGLVLYLVLAWKFNLTTVQLLAAVLTPVVFFNFFFARHAKAYFIALDHFCDPHRRDDGDGRGNVPSEPPPTMAGPTAGAPVAPEPCEPAAGVR
jgi:uncharacterized protein (DUF983 family)